MDKQKRENIHEKRKDWRENMNYTYGFIIDVNAPWFKINVNIYIYTRTFYQLLETLNILKFSKTNIRLICVQFKCKIIPYNFSREKNILILYIPTHPQQGIFR